MLRAEVHHQQQSRSIIRSAVSLSSPRVHFSYLPVTSRISVTTWPLSLISVELSCVSLYSFYPANLLRVGSFHRLDHWDLEREGKVFSSYDTQRAQGESKETGLANSPSLSPARHTLFVQSYAYNYPLLLRCNLTVHHSQGPPRVFHSQGSHVT